MVHTNGQAKPDIHPGNAKRLNDVMEDYVLTMQHALRQDLEKQLEQRAKDESGVLPPLSAWEMFTYLEDTDEEFYNWCFPFCAIRLTKKNVGYLHKAILRQFLASITPSETQVDEVQTSSE